MSYTVRLAALAFGIVAAGCVANTEEPQMRLAAASATSQDEKPAPLVYSNMHAAIRPSKKDGKFFEYQ